MGNFGRLLTFQTCLDFQQKIRQVFSLLLIMKYFRIPPLTIEKQIELLQEKGLQIISKDNSAHWLSNVSYFRLKQYSNKFKNAQTRNFVPNIDFDQLIDLYLFDRDLKFILFDAIETVEISFRTSISNSMAHKFGAHWYMDRDNFFSGFDLEEFLTSIESKLEDSDDAAIKQYKRMYDTPSLPPCWMIMEIISFGRISRMFAALES